MACSLPCNSEFLYHPVRRHPERSCRDVLDDCTVLADLELDLGSKPDHRRPEFEGSRRLRWCPSTCPISSFKPTERSALAVVRLLAIQASALVSNKDLLLLSMQGTFERAINVRTAPSLAVGRVGPVLNHSVPIYRDKWLWLHEALQGVEGVPCRCGPSWPSNSSWGMCSKQPQSVQELRVCLSTKPIKCMMHSEHARETLGPT